MQFQTGDVVRLKSGGPEMTVLEVFEETVSAGWFYKEKYESSAFPRAALVRDSEG